MRFINELSSEYCALRTEHVIKSKILSHLSNTIIKLYCSFHIFTLIYLAYHFTRLSTCTCIPLNDIGQQHHR